MAEQQEGLLKRLETQYYDYDIEHVPQEERKGTWGLIVVWFCWAFQFATIISGGVLASGLTLWESVWAIIIGDVILGIFAVIMSNIGLREGIGFSLQTRYSFGRRGTVIPSFIAGCVQLGWLFFCYWIFAYVFQVLFTFISPAWGTAGFFIGMIICTAITVIPVVYGYEGPKWVAYMSVIFLIVPIVYLISVLLASGGGLSKVAATYQPKQHSSFVFGITLTIGAWIFGTITSADWLRLGKNKWASFGAAHRPDRWRIPGAHSRCRHGSSHGRGHLEPYRGHPEVGNGGRDRLLYYVPFRHVGHPGSDGMVCLAPVR